MKRARTEKAKDQRRQLLLESALDEFTEKGFSAARMDDIAARASLSKGTLYLYFSSKEDLFHGLVETISMPRLEQIRAIAQQQGSLSGLLAGITDLAPVLVRESKLPKIMKVIIGESHSFPVLVTEYREQILDKLFTAIRSVAEESISSGEIIDVDADLLARLIMAPIVYAMLWEIIFGRDAEAAIDTNKLMTLHQQIMLSGLTKGD